MPPQLPFRRTHSPIALLRLALIPRHAGSFKMLLYHFRYLRMRIAR